MTWQCAAVRRSPTGRISAPGNCAGLRHGAAQRLSGARTGRTGALRRSAEPARPDPRSRAPGRPAWLPGVKPWDTRDGKADCLDSYSLLKNHPGASRPESAQEFTSRAAGAATAGRRMGSA